MNWVCLKIDNHYFGVEHNSLSTYTIHFTIKHIVTEHMYI